MKSIIVFYSYSGNTKKVAEILAGALAERGEVGQIELACFDESKTFLGQCHRAFFHIRGQIQPVKFDLSDYDLICFGTPVWAFAPAPAMNTYLDNCVGLEGKEIILFTTYGSGTGNERCLDYMRKILSQKGAKGFKRLSIQQGKVKYQEFVLSKIKEIN